MKDVLLPESSPVLVQEKSGSQQAVKFDLIAARIIPIDNYFVLNRQAGETTKSSAPSAIPPEVMTEILEKRIRSFYQGWADKPLPALDNKTPREAIATTEGLQQVKFLLHSYEHGEAQQAMRQPREPVSYDFLWQALGIKP